jgi:hypothetical protein
MPDECICTMVVFVLILHALLKLLSPLIWATITCVIYWRKLLVHKTRASLLVLPVSNLNYYHIVVFSSKTTNKQAIYSSDAPYQAKPARAASMDTLPPAQSPSAQALELGKLLTSCSRARSLEHPGEEKISSTVHRQKVKNARAGEHAFGHC